MTISIQDVVKANLVLVGLRLLGQPGEIEDFKRGLSADVQIIGAGLIADIPSGVTEPGHTLALSRDRITLDLSRSRSTISRDYPLREDLPRLAQVAGQATASTSLGGVQPRAFGFNLEMIFDQDSGLPAFGYLSSRLFDVNPLGNEDWQLVGGAGRLIFGDGPRRWTFSLEPRFNDDTESRVFASVNLHIDNQLLPNEAEIRASLEELWDNTLLLVERLDQGSGRHG